MLRTFLLAFFTFYIHFTEYLIPMSFVLWCHRHWSLGTSSAVVSAIKVLTLRKGRSHRAILSHWLTTALGSALRSLCPRPELLKCWIPSTRKGRIVPFCPELLFFRLPTSYHFYPPEHFLLHSGWHIVSLSVDSVWVRQIQLLSFYWTF